MLAVWLAGCVVDLCTTAIGTALMTIADRQVGGPTVVNDLNKGDNFVLERENAVRSFKNFVTPKCDVPKSINSLSDTPKQP